MVAVVALGCAALVNASELWASAGLTAVVGSLVVAVLAVVFRKGRARAFAGGFVICGSLYLIFAFGPWFHANLSPSLLTTKLLAYVHAKVQKEVPSQVAAVTMPSAPVQSTLSSDDHYTYAVRWIASTGTATPVEVPSWEHFRQVGHSLWAVLFAYLSGLLARYFYATRERKA